MVLSLSSAADSLSAVQEIPYISCAADNRSAVQEIPCIS
jgi:hypothetical protein